VKRIRLLINFLVTLYSVIKYGHRPKRYAHLITPKWARASMRTENRFRRAMKRPDKPQIPILKEWRLARYVALGGHMGALEAVVKQLTESSSYLRWVRAFTARTDKQTYVQRMILKHRIKQNRKLIREAIEY